MSNFINLIQPPIVKLSDSWGMNPEELKGKYFLCFNLSWPNASDESDAPEGREASGDCPKVYILITDDIAADQSLVQEFIKGLTTPAQLLVPAPGITLGENCFINETGRKILEESIGYAVEDDIVLYDYLTPMGTMSEAFEELDGFEANYTNVEYYGKKNNLLNMKIPVEDVENFYSTFCKIILDNTAIDEDTAMSITNQIYKIVLNFFKSFKYDETMASLSLVLNTPYTTSDKVNTCGCTSCGSSATNSTVNDPSVSKPCTTIYAEAMEEYLKKMLGDAQFYADWMYAAAGDYDKTPTVTPQMLLDLIDALLEMEPMINRSARSSLACGCSKIDTSLTDDMLETLNNYKKVLGWVRDCKIEENVNKIKVYGEEFGKILPTLQF